MFRTLLPNAAPEESKQPEAIPEPESAPNPDALIPIALDDIPLEIEQAELDDLFEETKTTKDGEDNGMD